MDATPRPWEFIPYDDKRRDGYIRRANAEVGEMAVAKVLTGRSYNEYRANAELIVRAVNSYDSMREALDLVHSIADAIVEGRHSASVVNWEKVREDIAKAMPQVEVSNG